MNAKIARKHTIEAIKRHIGEFKIKLVVNDIIYAAQRGENTLHIKINTYNLSDYNFKLLGDWLRLNEYIVETISLEEHINEYIISW